MSTNSECRLIEPVAGEWLYVLEAYKEEDEDVWDWRETASAYGPFESSDAAMEHLGRHHANPGSHGLFPVGQFRMDDTWQRLTDDAPRNMTQFVSSYGRGR